MLPQRIDHIIELVVLFILSFSCSLLSPCSKKHSNIMEWLQAGQESQWATNFANGTVLQKAKEKVWQAYNKLRSEISRDEIEADSLLVSKGIGNSQSVIQETV